MLGRRTHLGENHRGKSLGGLAARGKSRAARRASFFSRFFVGRPRRWLLGLLLLLCWVTTACQPSRTTDTQLPLLDELNGRIFPTEPVLILPNRAWRQHQTRKDIWFFGQSASMLCYASEIPAEPLTFIFYPEYPDHPPPLNFDWNGERVNDSARFLQTGEIRVTIEPQQIRPGRNFLTLIPDSVQRVQPGDSESASSFQHIGYQLGEELVEMPIEKLMGYRYLADLLQFSLSGSYGNEKMSGFVFVRKHTETIRLPNKRGGHFSTKVQNSTSGPGILRIAAGEAAQEVRLKAHQKSWLSLDVPAGIDRLTLSARTQDEGFFLWGSPYFRASESPQPTSIVLLTLDTTRRDMLAAYGGDPKIAPHLNAFAENATVFENALTTAPWTLPSHASMFTGLYPSNHGAGVINDHLEGQFETLAERLRDQNYLTLGLAGGTLAGFRFGLGQGFGIYTNPDGLETRADQLTKDGLKLLEQYGIVHKDSSTAEDGIVPPPFFLFLNYFDPHYPFNAPPPFQAQFNLPERLDQRPASDPWAEILRHPGPAWREIIEGQIRPKPEDLELLRDAYKAEVAFMDQQVGRLFEALKESGVYDDAMIIAVADHGELLGEHGFFSHSSRLDSELTEIPLIIKWPGQTTGRRVGQTVSVVDLFPTVLQTAGLPIPDDQDGLALHPRGGQGLDLREYVVMEEHDNDFHRLSPYMKIADRLFGFQTPVYRQLTWEDGDLCYTQEDQIWQPRECQEETASRVWRWRKWLEKDAFQPSVQRIGLSNEERSKLKALGYL